MGAIPPSCRGHDHPATARPVSRRKAESELLDLGRSAGFVGTVRWPAFMNARHRKSPRSYAQVTPGEHPVYELAEAVRWLPEQHRLALFAHEVGHVLDPAGSEDEADAAATEALGVSIGYDSRWPGKGLQVEASMKRRRNRAGAATCETGLEQWEDGFCPPRGELASQPSEKWLSGCPRELLLAVGQELGDLDVKALAKEQSCSAASVRKLLKELESIGAVKSYQPMAGLDKKGGRAYQLTTSGMDMADWLAFRDAGSASAQDTSFDFGALAAPAPPADRGDPWDWKGGKRDLGEITVEVERSDDYDSDPAMLRAYSSVYPEDPVGGLELWYSGRAARDERAYGPVGPEDYAMVGTMRVSPQFRRAGVATALLERAAREAAGHDRPLASPDNRTPEEAAWWAKQVKKRRATKIRHRSRKHPEASRYLLKYPPPESLANPWQRYVEPRQTPVWWLPDGREIVQLKPFDSPTKAEMLQIAMWEYEHDLTPEQQDSVAINVMGRSVFPWDSMSQEQLVRFRGEIARQQTQARRARNSAACQAKKHARCEGPCECWCHRSEALDNPRDAGRDVVIQHIDTLVEGYYSPSSFVSTFPTLCADAGTEVEVYGDMEEIDTRALYDQAENASRGQILEYLAELNRAVELENPPQAFGERSFRGAVAAARRLLATGPGSGVAQRMFARAVERCAEQSGIDPSDIATGAMDEARRETGQANPHVGYTDGGQRYYVHAEEGDVGTWREWFGSQGYSRVAVSEDRPRDAQPAQAVPSMEWVKQRLGR